MWKSSFSQADQVKTGNGWASVLSVHLSRGMMSSLMKRRYAYFNLQAGLEAPHDIKATDSRLSKEETEHVWSAAVARKIGRAHV